MASQTLTRPVGKRKAATALLSADKSQTQIAKELGVTPSAITRFKQRHAAELAGKLEELDAELLPTVLASKQRRLERLHEYLALTEQTVIARGGFIATEPRWIKGAGADGEGAVVVLERTDAALLAGVRGLLDDIAAEEGARVKAPLVAIQHNEIRVYDVGVAGSLPD